MCKSFKKRASCLLSKGQDTWPAETHTVSASHALTAKINSDEHGCSESAGAKQSPLVTSARSPGSAKENKFPQTVMVSTTRVKSEKRLVGSFR